MSYVGFWMEHQYCYGSQIFVSMHIEAEMAC